ncbi:MAG TPA: DUF6098 family protein [Micromonosporaceae bacterium]
MPTFHDLDELASLLEDAGPDEELYVRWSRGPDTDLTGDGQPEQSSRDALTGITMPGLSANPLRVEPWWGDRSTRLWVARRLYDYRHLRDLRGPGVRPWVFVGEQNGRGPDNEPLVVCHRPVGWVSDEALRESEKAVEEQGSDEWGPLHRAD